MTDPDFPFGPIPHWFRTEECLPTPNTQVLCIRNYPKLDTKFNWEYYVDQYEISIGKIEWSKGFAPTCWMKLPKAPHDT